MLLNVNNARKNLHDIVQFISEKDLGKIRNSINDLSEFFNKTTTNYYNSIYWSIEDFEGRAKQIYGETWRNTYDESKFDIALYEMITKHNPNVRVTWNTVDFYLDKYCIKTNANEKN